MSNQFKRLENGLLENVEYKYFEDGRIDWRSMIRSEFLAVQTDKKEDVEKRYGKKVKELNVHDIEDYYLIILLGGIKDLLRIRGYKSLTNRVDYVSESKAVVTTTIEFIPNFETGGLPLIYSDTASASVYSVSGVFQLHLEAIAANRSMVRCIRNALGINIAGKDEFDVNANKTFLAKAVTFQPGLSLTSSDVPESSGFEPRNILENRCKELGVTFENLKERSIKSKEGLVADPATWESFSSIQHLDAYTLISKLNTSIEKKAKK